MEKRSLFNELIAGVDNMQLLRKGKITLRSSNAKELAPALISGQEVIALRYRLHVSRTVFARYLRTKPRTN